jgi:hypothetical protein
VTGLNEYGGDDRRKVRVVQYDVKVLDTRNPTPHAWTNTGCLTTIFKMLKRILK